MSLSENSDQTNEDQEPVKMKKKKNSEKFDKSEFKSGHELLMEKSNKYLIADAGDELPSDADKKDRPKKKSSDVKKRKKRKSLHVLGEDSQKHPTVTDGLHSDVSEENNTKNNSPDVKKAKKKKQKEENIQEEVEEDNSGDSTCPVVPKKKKEKKKKKKKDIKDTQDGSEDSSISAQNAAINYLKTWSEDNVNWKFQKVRQVWLLQHMYDDSKVTNTDFDRLLLYLENLKGKAKEATLDKASKIIEAEDSSSDEDNNEDEKTVRARQVMQMLN